MALQFDKNGWLIPGSDSSIAVNTSIRTQKKTNILRLVGGRPVGIVWHWTGGNYGDGRQPWLRDWVLEAVVDPERKASWHFFIDRYGKLHQHASIYEGTWHVGMPGPVYVPGGGQPIPVPVLNVNQALLGVEMENAGILLKQNGNWYAWPYGPGGTTCTNKAACSESESFKNVAGGRVQFGERYKLSPARVVQWKDGVAYDAWTAAQIYSARELTRALKNALGWQLPEQVHYSHEQFIPWQKKDPGALWMDSVLPGIERNVFGRAAWQSNFLGKLLLVAAVGGAGYYLWRKKQRGELRLPDIRWPWQRAPAAAMGRLLR